jgi:uncharacterized DUF497 family protein
MGIFENFIWDDTKDAANIQKHSASLRLIYLLFNDPNRVIEDVAPDRDTGEPRFLITAAIDDLVFRCIYVKRGDIIRAISLHKVSGRLKREYLNQRTT